MTRFATVRNARSAREVWAYLPGNYNIVGGDMGAPGSPVYVIAGEDVAGWTLDGYVVPRLASGTIIATEVDPDYVEATRETIIARA
jgi:hypothetical protein